MLTSDQLYAVAGCATVAGGAVGWLAGHLRTTRRYERDGGLMDQTYYEGRDDERGRADETGGTPVLGGVLADAGRQLQLPEPGPDGMPATRVDPCGAGASADFLHPDFEQLGPARLDAANPDLPGPDGPLPRNADAPGHSSDGGRAGEHHMDAPLPTVLSLGTEYDGGPQTAARVAWRLWDMTARYEQERARFRAECGLGIAA